MELFSRGEFDKKIARNVNVPLRCFIQKHFPIFGRNRIAFPPPSCCLNIHAGVISQNIHSRPRAHHLCKGIHSWMNYGRYAQHCQIRVGWYVQYLNGVGVGQYVP